jgi:hypothetical protein
MDGRKISWVNPKSLIRYKCSTIKIPRYASDNNHSLQLRNQLFQLIYYLPSWHNIIIEKPLRKFLTLSTNVNNLEKFLNLNRNAKYQQLQIDIKNTFNLLKGEEGTLNTSFQENKFRRKKIQLLIEELPCIQQVQKSLNSLYKDRLCEQDEEDFYHIWLCEDRIMEMNDFVSLTKSSLIEHIKSNIDNQDVLINIQDISNLHIWDIEKDDTKLTFIDLIKGFIPKNLTLFIDNFTNQKLKTTKVLYQLRTTMYQHIFRVYWLKRCKEMEKKDLELGINKRLKKKHYGKDCLYKTREQSSIPKLEHLIGIRNNIYYGSDTLEYYDDCTS